MHALECIFSFINMELAYPLLTLTEGINSMTPF